jgi:hypothetical protein
VAAEIPTTEPAELRAGDTWKWTKSLSDFPASYPWTLKYRFKHPTAAGFEIVASASGDNYAVTETAATTTGRVAGTYTWTAWVEGGSSEKYTVDEGTLVVLADYRAVSAAAVLDDRSDARVIYEALITAYKSAVASRAFVSEYEIAGRRMKFESRAGWIKEINFWKAQCAAEVSAEAIANGTGTGRRIQFRLG